jgi:hypothetical protein
MIHDYTPTIHDYMPTLSTMSVMLFIIPYQQMHKVSISLSMRSQLVFKEKTGQIEIGSLF